MKHTIASAIVALLPNAGFNASTTYDSIQWDSDNSDAKPSESVINSKITALDNEEPKRLLRLERNRLLSECDWTRLDDNGLGSSKKTEWATYRQALRDLPATQNPTLDSFYELNFSSVTWPTKPS